MPILPNLLVQSSLDIPGFSGEMKNARYIEVHGISRYVLRVNTAKHAIWGKNTVHGISRNTVYRGTVYRGFTVVCCKGRGGSLN